MLIFADDFGLQSNKFCRRMMKKVYLLRHAQSAGKQAGQRDYDRDLTPEGERQVNNLASLIVKARLLPEFIMSSSSVRTRRTAQLIQSALQLPATQVRFLDSLYEATTREWIQQLKQMPEGLNTVLLIGHNPAISHLGGIFAGRSIDLPACGFVAFEFPGREWKEFAVAGVELTQILIAS